MKCHIYRASKITRVRRVCPYHKVLHYGSQHEYYDTTLIFFDCGTEADYGYGEWRPPKSYKKLTIFQDEVGYSLMALGNVISSARTKRGIRAMANQRLKPSGEIKDLVTPHNHRR